MRRIPAILLALAISARADGGVVRRVPIDGTNPLFVSLVACYDLDEADGTRADSSGNGYDLTDNNTVTQNTGIIGSAGQFTSANSEYLSIADAADFRVTGDKTWSMWAYFDAQATDMTMIGKLNGTSDLWEYAISYIISGGAKLRFRLYYNDSFGSTDAAITTTLDNATWYYVTCRYRASDAEMGISLNNGTETTATLGGTAEAGGSAFILGRILTASYMNGRLDVVKVWNRRITDAEITSDYNGGAGVACP